ncbi:MAG: PQQ-binding-like beta-propeller repeat protein, partial [Chitinivibrionales bacterium]|nr:PQQ-binding-like beta-propeller repeat protein [Chitinivibrionales bacterium]
MKAAILFADALIILLLATGALADRADDLSALAGVQGGLVVILDDDTELAMQFHAKGGWLVHVLVADDQQAATVRQALRAAGMHDKVSAEVLADSALPYVDRLVKLLIAPNGLGTVSVSEVHRVLSPLGVALIDDGSGWNTVVQPWPASIGEWTHYLSGPDGNCVSSDDEIAEPKGVRWNGGPRWDRHHKRLAGTSAMVSAMGRVFWIRDTGATVRSDAPREFQLAARDAFSGVTLWTRPLPWYSEPRNFRTGPAHLTRGLVVDGNRLFVTIPYHGPVMLLDAATGDSLRTYPQTVGAQEVVFHNGTLYVVTAFERPEEATLGWKTKEDLADQTALIAVNASTGETFWQRATLDFTLILPLTVAVSDAALAVHTAKRFFCLDPLTGVERWSVPRVYFTIRPGWAAPTVSIVDDVILVADQAEMSVNDPTRFADAPADWLSWNAEQNDCGGNVGTLHAFAIHDGAELWSTPCAAGYAAPPDVFYADGLVWVGTTESRKDADFQYGRDLHTGQIQRTIATADVVTGAHHHRCHRPKATNNFILPSRNGIELIDLNGLRNDRNTWVRGACQYGILPANGLLYAPPHSCGCFLQAKLAGLWALAPQGSPWDHRSGEERLETLSSAPAATPNWPDDWPTYRHDMRRSGTTPARLDGPLHPAWEAPLGTQLSAPVIARGVVYVAEVNGNTIHALALEDGNLRWSYTADGRIDSPPTIVDGLVIFGSTDGRVHCLRADNGLPVWRFMAAPSDRRIVSYGRLESVWPVHGSVLVQNGAVWVVAGRSTYLDSGFACYRLDPRTGAVLSQGRIHTDNVETGNADELYGVSGRMKGALDDILSGDGTTAFMRQYHFGPDFEELPNTYHLFGMVGFLDDTWFSRSYWQYGPYMWGFYRGWPMAADYVPFGRILCMDGDTAFGYRRKAFGADIEDQDDHVLYRATMNQAIIDERMPSPFAYDWSNPDRSGCVTRTWGNDTLPIWVRAMAVTADAVVAAGPNTPRNATQATASLKGLRGSRLIVSSRETGAIQLDTTLASPPVWDGLAAVPGFVIICTIDGSVRCFRAEGSTSIAADATQLPHSAPVSEVAPAATSYAFAVRQPTARTSVSQTGAQPAPAGHAKASPGAEPMPAELPAYAAEAALDMSPVVGPYTLFIPGRPAQRSEHVQDSASSCERGLVIEAEDLIPDTVGTDTSRAADNPAWTIERRQSGFSGRGYVCRREL